MLLSLSVVRMCSVVRFLERFGNCEMEWTEGIVRIYRNIASMLTFLEQKLLS
jgi:hypothetical protein